MIAANAQVSAAGSRNDRSIESVQSRSSGDPIMAVISLHSQKITIYDANGWILRAPVSSGQKGRETPAGIFSVIEKQAEHYSNLYDDAFMPHMQRITWSGIALHGGPLPGYAASHGCIRLPYDFAEHLFGLTKVGMRVIVAPNDVAPVEITHPALSTLRSSGSVVVAARAKEANEAAGRTEQAARLAAVKASREAQQAATAVRVAENASVRAQSEVTAAEGAIASARSDQAKAKAETAKEKATARVAEIEAQLAAAKADLQPKLDAVAAAREAADAAATAKAAAADAAQKAARALEPVSVFISRKTQRLYVRQAFQPVLDTAVTIQDADRPIGTHVFTAEERTGDDGSMRWSVVSMDKGYAAGGKLAANAIGPARDIAAVSDGPSGAMAALDRITIPQDVLDRIGGMGSPRSSLIISDEGLSSETSKGTDFVVVMSGEPQGGISFRHHSPVSQVHYQRPRERRNYFQLPFARPYFFW